jgi:hypothetical protein
MLVTSIGLPVMTESDAAVRSIWPPPSPCEPSILTGSATPVPIVTLLKYV